MARPLAELELSLRQRSNRRQQERALAQRMAAHLARRVGDAHRHFVKAYEHGDSFGSETGQLIADATTLSDTITPTEMHVAHLDLITADLNERLTHISTQLGAIKNL